MTSNASARRVRAAAERALKESEREPSPEPTPWPQSSDRRYFADGLTRYGHPGQCSGCGTWRTDGRPPTVHRHGCVYGPDGSQLPPVFDPAPLARIARSAVNATLTARHPPRNRR